MRGQNALDLTVKLNDKEIFEKYGVIEIYPIVSRSSALASKATGYPIANRL